MSDISNWRKTVPYNWLQGPPEGQGNPGLGYKARVPWECSKEKGSETRFSDFILLSQLETVVRATFTVLGSQFYLSKWTFTKQHEIHRKKNRRASFHDKKNNALTESWTVHGDYESIYKLQGLLVMLTNIFFLLNRAGGFGTAQSHAIGMSAPCVIRSPGRRWMNNIPQTATYGGKVLGWKRRVW